MTAGAELGRAAFERRSWREAYEVLASVESLEVGDLERLAVAAYLVGRDDDSAAAWEQAFVACLEADDHERAARCAFWLALVLVLRGETARGTGWLARADRLIEGAGPGSAARGYLLVASFLEKIEAGDADEAAVLADRIVEIAERIADRDLLALGLLSRGQASLRLGEVAKGFRLLDEAMVSATSGEVSPIPAGIVCCAVIEACVECFDLRRATQWTDALSAWCSVQPDMVPYRGQCLVHRSQILQARGNWSEAVAEVGQASERLTDPFHPALGIARYQQAELHRLQGEFAEAAQAYQEAAELGRDPSPGLALLRLAMGEIEQARVAIRRMLVEAANVTTRPAVLAAAVEIYLAAGDVAAARTASDELSHLAGIVDAPMLHAIADGAAGSVLAAEGDAAAALTALRRALTTWGSLRVPYEMARVRLGIARACAALGDGDATALEVEAARATFERLGAAPDLRRLDVRAGEATSRPDSLTERELEVLRLLASGRTNREIADVLVISVHTVARHVQNIFLKLGLSSRAAATAYAYEHDLVR